MADEQETASVLTVGNYTVDAEQGTVSAGDKTFDAAGRPFVPRSRDFDKEPIAGKYKTLDAAEEGIRNAEKELAARQERIKQREVELETLRKEHETVSKKTSSYEEVLAEALKADNPEKFFATIKQAHRETVDPDLPDLSDFGDEKAAQLTAYFKAREKKEQELLERLNRVESKDSAKEIEAKLTREYAFLGDQANKEKFESIKDQLRSGKISQEEALLMTAKTFGEHFRAEGAAEKEREAAARARETMGGTSVRPEVPPKLSPEEQTLNECLAAALDPRMVIRD